MGFAYKITDQQGIHFVTATVVQWVDVFTRSLYADMVIESIKFCQQKKGLCIYGWVIMSNHLHMICSCKEGFELSNTLRDFKKYTSTKIVDTIESNKAESRKIGYFGCLDKVITLSSGSQAIIPRKLTR
jgi:putative transposase